MTLCIKELKRKSTNWSYICLGRPYHFTLVKGGFPQILLGPFLNTLSHLTFSSRSIRKLLVWPLILEYDAFTFSQFITKFSEVRQLTSLLVVWASIYPDLEIEKNYWWVSLKASKCYGKCYLFCFSIMNIFIKFWTNFVSWVRPLNSHEYSLCPSFQFSIDLLVEAFGIHLEFRE